MARTAFWALRFTTNTLIRAVRAVQSHKSLYASKDKPSYAVITGGSGGLGMTFAKQLAEKGFNIVLIARNAEKLEVLANEIRTTYNVLVKCIAFDFGAGDYVKNWLKLEEELKGLDIAILVNNLGAYSWVPFERQPDEPIQELIQNCVYAPTFMTRLVVSGMLQRKAKSAVINIGSFASEIRLQTTVVNCAAKRYIHRLTLALARDYEDANIDFLCVIPGLIDTPGLKAWKAGTPILMSTQLEVVTKALSHLKSANQRGNTTNGTLNHRLFIWLQTNSLTRKWFVKKVYKLAA